MEDCQMKNSTNNLLKISISLSGVMLVVVIWSLFSGSLNPLILPSPVEVGRAVLELARSGELGKNFLITFRRTLVGFAIAFFFGISIALLMKKNLFFRQVFKPLVTFVQTTPPVVWLVLSMIWFGLAQELTPVFIIFIVVFPIVLINFLEGLESFDTELIQMAKVFGSKRKRILFHILLPGMSPLIISSARVGLAFAWKSTVLAEFLGSSSGIGFMLSAANSLLDTSQVFAWALILILAMLGLEYLVIDPVRGRVNRWIKCAGS